MRIAPPEHWDKMHVVRQGVDPNVFRCGMIVSRKGRWKSCAWGGFPLKGPTHSVARLQSIAHPRLFASCASGGRGS